jgi:hypothetical protein
MGLKTSEEHTWMIDVLSCNPENPVDYVALSHDWADGLGSPTDNSLPTCQHPGLQDTVVPICSARER